MYKNINCIFCKIINKEIKSNIIYENEYICAFLDINPISYGHTIVIPKKHFKNLTSANKIYLTKIMHANQIIAKKIKEKLNPKGFNFLINENLIAGQEIFHLHSHIIPKYVKEEGFILNIKRNTKLNNLKDIKNKIK